MGLVVVVFLDEQFPVFVGFLQGFNLLSPAFRDIGVNQPVVNLYFALAGCGIWFRPEMPDPQTIQRPDQLRGNELFPIVYISGLKSAPLQDRLPVNILHNIRVLVVIHAGRQDKP